MLESRLALPLRHEGRPAAQRTPDRRRRELRSHAQILDPARQERHRSPGPQQQAAVPVRSARSGLVARRPLHGPDRRGARIRRHQDQGAGLQHDPQAREGRARPLVLPLRQGRHDRMAGHAQRRPGSAVADAQLLHRRGAPPLGRIGGLLPQGVEGDHRLPLLVPVDRRLGSVQRGMGTVQGPRDRRMDQGLRPEPSGEPRQRRQPLPHGRHPRPAPLPAAEDDAARHQPGHRTGRIRRHRPGDPRPRLGQEPRQLGLHALQLPEGGDRRICPLRRRTAPPDRLRLRCRRLHADDRRRGGGKRPDDLRPQGGEGRGGAYPGDQPHHLQIFKRTI